VGAVVRGVSPDCVSVVQGRSDAGAARRLPLGTIVVEVSVGDMSGRTVYVRVSPHDEVPV
jgi:hypothetical protein